MNLFHTLPGTQTALALSIFFGSFVYEDGATLLAATLAAAGRLDSRLGLLSAFLGIWIGDVGLYVLGATFGRRAAQSGWLQKLVTPDALSKAEAWFARHGSLALVMSRAIPGSRLPLYVGAGALRLPARMFTAITAICSAVWVVAIFSIWRFVPRGSAGRGGLMPWFLTAALLLSPWLLGTGMKPLGRRLRMWVGGHAVRAGSNGAVSLCAR